MSIATEITRINNAKAALKTAIEGKGVTVPESTTLDGYAALVDALSGGGSATLITKTITENGTYDAEDDSADGYSEVTVNVQPPQEAHSKDVNFYDYDGKILYSYTAAEFANLTALPANPTHSGLTSQGWNWTLADAKAQVTAVGACDIGQMYVTSDGKTRLYCTFEEFNKSFYFGLGVNGTVTIDWGDGSSTSTLTGTNNGTVKNVQHTYADAGDYVITLEIGSGGSFAFFGYSQCGYLFKGNTSNVYANRAYARCLKKIEMGTGAYMRNYGLSYCVNLETVTVNNNAFLGSTALFAGCTKLKFVTIPNSSLPTGKGNSHEKDSCLPPLRRLPRLRRQRLRRRPGIRSRLRPLHYRRQGLDPHRNSERCLLPQRRQDLQCRRCRRQERRCQCRNPLQGHC